MKPVSDKDFRSIAVLFFILLFFGFYKIDSIIGWQDAGADPPLGNVNSPLNISSGLQIKSGPLKFTTFYDLDDAYYINPDGSPISAVFNGNVGIGTTTPSYKLSVEGTAFATGDFRAPVFYDSDNPTGYYIDPNGTSSVAGFIVEEIGAGYLLVTNAFRAPHMFDEDDPTWHYYLDPAGTSTIKELVVDYVYAGMGYFSVASVAPVMYDYDDQTWQHYLDPTGTSNIENLVVKNNLRYEHSYGTYGNHVCSSDLGFGGLGACSSSREYKNSIAYFEDQDYKKALEEIKNTNVASFKYNDEENDLTHIGIIAEEAPEQLKFKDNKGNANVDFLSVQTGYTWAGIRALAEQADVLEQELNLAKKEIADLKGALENQQKQIENLEQQCGF